ncbi:aminopeptidase P family protein [Ancylobacter dichloromethanicus]|uniref:Aminopeptidase n=1 Tax=Ancylobacter dichloromethanicus TaxID=518825 RepID=A0A9W6J4Y3_9HYPH|nr:aminopeptidase P family protein [Ancylobacter dichloromethanicus]MBS7555237.1 aminopeptidase P family protein [Ancylobacter dichloromethanicus]GLK70417.1 aminopeptidase [Ancylobacter dichloromethanicus]
MFEAKFQTFADSAAPALGTARLRLLREELGRRGLDGFIVPRADAHQNEYVPPSDERLAWLTGFTGSAGVALVLRDEAAIVVDGRYTLQAAAQVDPASFEVVPLAETAPERWLEKHLTAGTHFGYDPWLTTVEGEQKLRRAATSAGATLVAVDGNPLDAVWHDRPAAPLAPVTLRDPALAGESAPDKIGRVQAALGEQKLDALVLSDPHSVAWTFNIRGGDVAFTPLPLSWALVPQSGRPTLFVDGRKLSNTARDALAQFTEIAEPVLLERAVEMAASGGATVRLDQSTAPSLLAARIEAAGGKVSSGASPVALMQAAKNAAELAGMRAAHRRDGAALARFLAWFDTEAPKGTLTEIDAVCALETFRRDTGALKDISFPSISGAGPNGAIVHYRVSEATNRPVRPDELFLIDSGAQYEDGTTDVTRTLVVGTASAEMRDRFTRVLKGHIAIARAVFPRGTTGAQLDSFARQHLWAAGLDFDHGTGHGVGAYLSVHEGPARISRLGTVALARGMVLSNEPGYYKAGAYGIRLENLEIVVDGPAIEGAEKALLAFETLTLAPFDRRGIEPARLTPDETAWLDAYHARVRAEIGPLLDEGTRLWLEAATAPLGG